MKKLLGIVVLGLLLSVLLFNFNSPKVKDETLVSILKIAKKTSRWKNDTAEDELLYHKQHCITKDYRQVQRRSGCGFDIDARTFLDIKMVSEIIYNQYGDDPKLFWEKLTPLRKEITEIFLKKT